MRNTMKLSRERAPVGEMAASQDPKTRKPRSKDPIPNAARDAHAVGDGFDGPFGAEIEARTEAARNSVLPAAPRNTVASIKKLMATELRTLRDRGIKTIDEHLYSYDCTLNDGTTAWIQKENPTDTPYGEVYYGREVSLWQRMRGQRGTQLNMRWTREPGAAGGRPLLFNINIESRGKELVMGNGGDCGNARIRQWGPHVFAVDSDLVKHCTDFVSGVQQM